MFDFDNLPIFLGFLAVGIGLVVMMSLAIALVVRAIFRNAGGGMGRLLEHYPAGDTDLEGYRYAYRRTVQAGNVVIKNCATIGVGPRGLYLCAPWRPPVLIPWTEVRSVQPTKLYWREAISLSIGDPSTARLTVFPEDFGAMRPYLSNRVHQDQDVAVHASGTT